MSAMFRTATGWTSGTLSLSRREGQSATQLRSVVAGSSSRVRKVRIPFARKALHKAARPYGRTSHAMLSCVATEASSIPSSSLVGECRSARDFSPREPGLPSSLSSAIETCARGDASTFGQVYDAYMAKVYRYALYMCGNPTEAEDMTEETFVKVWQGLPSFMGNEAAFTTWLMRIAHNHVVDHLRQRRHDTIPLSAYEPDIASPPDDGPQNIAERRLLGQQVLHLAAELPPQQRQVIVLKFVEGLDTREISAITKQKEGAIRIAQMRALQTLRALLGKEVTTGG